jgi:hypothetical protein
VALGIPDAGGVHSLLDPLNELRVELVAELIQNLHSSHRKEEATRQLGVSE